MRRRKKDWIGGSVKRAKQSQAAQELECPVRDYSIDQARWHGPPTEQMVRLLVEYRRSIPATYGEACAALAKGPL